MQSVDSKTTFHLSTVHYRLIVLITVLFRLSLLNGNWLMYKWNIIKTKDQRIIRSLQSPTLLILCVCVSLCMCVCVSLHVCVPLHVRACVWVWSLIHSTQRKAGVSLSCPELIGTSSFSISLKLRDEFPHAYSYHLNETGCIETIRGLTGIGVCYWSLGHNSGQLSGCDHCSLVSSYSIPQLPPLPIPPPPINSLVQCCEIYVYSHTESKQHLCISIAEPMCYKE